MALDPNILALTATPPKPQDPLERYGRVLALKNAMQQGNLQSIQVQEAQRNQQREQAAQTMFSQAAQPGSTMPTDQEILGKLGPSMGGSVLKNLREAEKARLDIQKTKGEIAGAEADYAGGLGAMVRDAGYSPDAWNLAVQHAQQAGYGDTIGQLNQAVQQDPTKIKQIADEMISRSPKQQEIANSRKTAQGSADRGAAATQQAATSAAKEGREAGQQQFQNAISDLAANPPKTALEYRQRISALPTEQAMRIMEAAPIGQYDPATTPAMLRKLGMNPEQQAQNEQAAANTTQTAAHNKVEEQQGAQRIALEGQNVELRNKEYQQRYGDVLGSLSPDQLAVATKLAHGEMSPAQLSRYPDKEKLTAAAIRINPAWTQATYDTNQSFTNPEKGQAKNLGTISRIVGHIGRFEENSKDIGLAPGFAMGMKLTGPQSKLSEDSHAIAGELEKLVSGGVGSMEQTRAWQKALSSPFPSARQQAVDEISQLIGSQYEGMSQTFKAGTGADLPIEKYVSPAGREWMKSKKINVAGAASQSVSSAPSGYAQTATGPGGHKIGSNDGGKTWLDVKTGKPI